jgi:hypothetical protein
MTRNYVGEFNRCIGDNIRRCARQLRRLGLDAEPIPHKTALRIGRPEHITWPQFKDAIRSVIQPGRGSVLLFSQHTGNAFVCSNSGNQPGVFQKFRPQDS